MCTHKDVGSIGMMFKNIFSKNNCSKLISLLNENTK